MNLGVNQHSDGIRIVLGPRPARDGLTRFSTSQEHDRIGALGGCPENAVYWPYLTQNSMISPTMFLSDATVADFNEASRRISRPFRVRLWEAVREILEGRGFWRAGS